MCRVILHMSLVFSFKPGIAATMLDLNHAVHGNYSPMRYSITWYYIEKQTKNQVLHKKTQNLIAATQRNEYKKRGEQGVSLTVNLPERYNLLKYYG